MYQRFKEQTNLKNNHSSPRKNVSCKKSFFLTARSDWPFSWSVVSRRTQTTMAVMKPSKNSKNARKLHGLLRKLKNSRRKKVGKKMRSTRWSLLSDHSDRSRQSFESTSLRQLAISMWSSTTAACIEIKRASHCQTALVYKLYLQSHHWQSLATK